MKSFIGVSVAVTMTMGAAFADINSELLSLQAQVDQLQTQISASSSRTPVVGVDPSLSWQMMSNQSGVGKEMNLLAARQAGLNTPLTLGGFAEGDAIYQHTNSTGANNASEFNLVPLSNGATFSNTTGQSASSLFLSNVDLATTAAIGSWMTAYIQAGAKNAGSSSSSSTLQIQDAYLVAGNLAKNPVYGFAGKKEIDFGRFASVNMYYAPLTREFFEGIGNTAGIGMNAYGFNGTMSIMNGGTDGTNSNLFTTDDSSINNYALNLNYGMNTRGIHWNIGAGYLHGSRFLTTSNGTNGAWDLNGKLSVAGFDFLAEYTATTSKSYGATSNSLALATVAQTVAIWDLGADYNFPIMGINSTVNVDYSQANLANGAANHLMQWVAGYRIEPVNNVWTGVEYAYNQNGINPSTGSLYGSAYNSNTLLLDVTAAF